MLAPCGEVPYTFTKTFQATAMRLFSVEHHGSPAILQYIYEHQWDAAFMMLHQYIIHGTFILSVRLLQNPDCHSMARSKWTSE